MEDNMHADTAPPVNCRMFPTSRLMNLIICRARIRCKSRLKYRCTQHARPHVPERAEVNMEDNMRVDIAPGRPIVIMVCSLTLRFISVNFYSPFLFLSAGHESVADLSHLKHIVHFVRLILSREEHVTYEAQKKPANSY